MANWWKSGGAANLTRGLTSLTGQLSNNLKDILSEASEETFDPSTELERARQQIQQFEYQQQILSEECENLKKQCEELSMQKQAVEIKSEMLLAESRRTIESKDSELKKLRETSNVSSWNSVDERSTSWTDILEEDQTEISEFVKYQKAIRDLKDENQHLREELSNLRKSTKNAKIDKIQQRREEEILQIQSAFAEQISKMREDFEAKLSQSRSQLEQLDQENRTLQEENRRRCEQIEKEKNDEKEILAEEVDQANVKLHSLNDKVKQLEETIESLRSENELKTKINEENRILIDELSASKEKRDEAEQIDLDEDSRRILFDEQQRSKLLLVDNEQVRCELEQSISLVQSLKKQLEEKEILENENEQKRIRFEEEVTRLDDELKLVEQDKEQLREEIEQLREEMKVKDRLLQNDENSSNEVRTRSPSPQTFEHVLQLEAEVLRHEKIFVDLNSIYEKFLTLLPIEVSSNDREKNSLNERFENLLEQWSTYVDTLNITQQELESVKQLLIEKQDEIERIQIDLDAATSQIVENEQKTSAKMNDEQNEEEIEEILELRSFPHRAPSRQSIVCNTPGEKQQLIAQNELLSSLLAEKDREIILLQQADKNRDETEKNFLSLQNEFKQLEREREIKQVELNDIRNVLDEKLRENSSLKKEKMSFIEKLAELERERQEQSSIIQVVPKQSSAEDQRPSSTKPEENNDDSQSEDKYEKLRVEYEQLLGFSKKQHDESTFYYNEYNRIVTLYNELNEKFSQTQIEYESLQSLIQQKTEAFLHAQNELSQLQNLFYHEKKKSEEVDGLQSKLVDKERKLHEFMEREANLLVKQSELEREIKLNEQQIFELKSNEQLFIQQFQTTNVELFQSEFKRLEAERDSIRQKLNQTEEREKKLSNEIERLRNHLIQMEETYTNDLLTAEDREKNLRNEIAQLQDSNRAQLELIQQLNTSGEQSKQTLATELGTLKYEFSKVEATNLRLNEQLQYQMKCSQNLQNVLDQFKREREQHINDHLRQYQETIREQTRNLNQLNQENNQIRTKLAEYDEALAAARRLTDQIEKKDLLLRSMQNQIDESERKIQQYESSLRDFQSTNGTRVEKQLVKNILLSYFHTPADKRQEVIPLLGALVGFTQEEYRKAIDANSNSNPGRNATSAGWLSGWLGGNHPSNSAQSGRNRTLSETPAYDPNKSFTELLIQYVDQQSANNPQSPSAKFNTDQYLQRHDQHTPSAFNSNILRKTNPTTLNNPFVTLSNQPINRPASALVFPTSSASFSSSDSTAADNSSDILKDLLKS